MLQKAPLTSMNPAASWTTFAWLHLFESYSLDMDVQCIYREFLSVAGPSLPHLESHAPLIKFYFTLGGTNYVIYSLVIPDNDLWHPGNNFLHDPFVVFAQRSYYWFSFSTWISHLDAFVNSGGFSAPYFQKLIYKQIMIDGLHRHSLPWGTRGPKNLTKSFHFFIGCRTQVASV